jgi:predicted PurR-regulated permease PerM
MKRTLAVPGAVTIISALIGSSLLGLVGGLLAVPVAASIILILDEVVIPRANNSESSEFVSRSILDPPVRSKVRG